MTIEFLKKDADPGVITLGFSGGASLSLDTFYLEPARQNLELWRAGRELSPEEEEALEFAALCRRIEKKALALVTRAEQTCRGLARKLEQRGFNHEEVRAVVSRLAGLGLVDDRRYGELWLRSRLSRKGGRPPGPRFLRASLESRGLDKKTAGEVMEKVLDQAAERALLSRFLESGFRETGFQERNGSWEDEGGGSFIRNRLKAEGFSSGVIQDHFLNE